MRYLIAASLVLFVSCASTVRIVSDYNASDFAVTSLKASSARLYVSHNVDVQEFKKSFETEYDSIPRFVLTFGSQMADSLRSVATVTVGKGEETDMIFLGPSFSDDRVARTKAVFDSAGESYFIGIKKITISNDYTNYGPTYSPGTTVATPGGNMTVGGGWFGGGQSEKCVVSFQSEIWSVQEKRKVSEFTSYGESTVFLFSFGSALKSAVEDAIQSFCRYVRENKMK